MLRASALLIRMLPFAVLSLLLLRMVAPIVSYDSWWYHFPFSSCLYDIGGGCRSFHMDPVSLARFDGFPKVWELAQGAAWLVTGSLWSIVLPQLLLCAAYLWTVRRTLRVPTGLLLAAVFACPMLVLHVVGTNNDLPGALGIAIGFFLLAELLAAPAAPSDWAKAAGAIAAFALAGNIKYQALIGCLAVGLAIGVPCLVLRGIAPRRRAGVLLVLVLAGSAAAGWALVNAARFGNPFYPREVSLAGRAVFAGPESENDGQAPPAYLLYESRRTTLPGPVNFVLSATELDWTMRGVAPWYSMGSETGEVPRRGGPSRTGGWGGVFVLVNLAVLLWQLVRPSVDRRQRVLAVAGGVLCLATACLPRAYELRYWMYLPLILAPLNLRFLLQVEPIRGLVPPVLSGLMVLSLALIILSPRSRILEPGLRPFATRQAEVPIEVRDAVTARGIYCNADNETLFRWSGAVTGLPGILSRNPADCR